MSGGPVFWITENQYGIFGIIYEGGLRSSECNQSDVYVFAELATPEVIRGWIGQLETDSGSRPIS